ncbi:MAG: DUF3387 domain-containing protein [Phycisphaerae bacterium]|jgi:type I site-specific restriction-modification system R (restriction) subunit
MAQQGFTDSVVEQAALAWLEALGFAVAHGPEIAPGELAAERDDYGQVVLHRRLRDALARLNPDLPPEALDEAFRRLTRPESADLVANNRALHRMLVDGVNVEYRRTDGTIAGAQARVIDFDDPDANDWLAVNLVQARSFAEMLENAIKRYQNRAIEAAQVIEELIELAKEMRAADRRGEQLGLSEEEIAFYDALEVNDSAVRVLGEPTLRTIAREVVEAVRNNTTIDWTIKESVRARLRVLVKRILRKYGYPPDKQEKATQTVLQQAELLCANVL